MKVVSVRLDNDVYKSLLEYCKAERINYTAFIRNALHASMKSIKIMPEIKKKHIYYNSINDMY